MTHDTTLEQAYAVCRAIARREAKNFYYAFIALPPARKNAICAIYAFMRKADDLADDESLSRDERRRRLETWLADWRGVCHGGDSSDPVFRAVRDATERFSIPLNLLDELVAGTTMDLKTTADAVPDTYATFDDLYRYCYLVASVVGLVCIHIFGYKDPRAEKLAEETGIAFQLTNILRDVAEDAGRGRLYLPAAYLDEAGVAHDPAAILAHPARAAVCARVAVMAHAHFAAAAAAMRRCDRRAMRPARLMGATYEAVLARLERRGWRDLATPAKLPRAEKLWIALRHGLA